MPPPSPIPVAAQGDIQDADVLPDPFPTLPRFQRVGPVSAIDFAAPQSDVIGGYASGRRRLIRVTAVVAVTALAAGSALGWRLGSPSVPWPPTNPEQALHNAVAATLQATSYTLDESIFLKGIGGKETGKPFETVRTVYQAPDRFKVNFPYSLLAPASVVMIGPDCWISGVPSAVITSGSFKCGSVANGSGIAGLLHSLGTAVDVSVTGQDLTFQPQNTAAFLTQSNISLSGVTTVQVRVTLNGPYIGTVTVSGNAASPNNASSSAAFGLSGSVGIGFSAIDSSSVARPSGSPTEINGQAPGTGST